MQTITINIEDKNVIFLTELLKKLNFSTEIQKVKIQKRTKEKASSTPIRLPEGKPSISDFAGFWSENPKTLTQIRDISWKRI